MSTTTFKGARYVPKFYGNWTDEIGYEAIGVVKHNAFTYISKQPVPAGVQISNTDFWLLWADPNAQMEELRQIFMQYVDTVEELSGVVGQWADELAAEIQDRENADLALSEKIDTDIEAAVNENIVETGIAVAFGDSITRGYGLENPTSENWFAQLCSRNNWTQKNYAVDGAAFARVSNSIGSQIDTAIQDATLDKTKVKYVFLNGGINDRRSAQTDIESAISECISKIRANFPNAKYYSVPNLCAANSLNNINQGDSYLIHVPSVTVVNNYLKRFNNIYVFADAWKWLQGFASFSQDQVHPNKEGAQIIANNVNAELHGAHQLALMQCVDSDTSTAEIIPTATQEYLEMSGSTAHIFSDGNMWKCWGVFQVKAQTTIPALTVLCNTGRITNGDDREAIPVLFVSYYDGMKGKVGYIRRNSLSTFEPIVNDGDSARTFYWSVCGIVGM